VSRPWISAAGAAGAVIVAVGLVRAAERPAASLAAARGHVYYVDQLSGDDANAGTSPAQAWKTLRRAGSVTYGPGDRLLLRRGESWRDALRIHGAGTSARPIVIGAYGSGTQPLLQTASSCVTIDASHVAVTGLHVDRCGWAGVEIRGSDVRVRRMLVTRNVAGIVVRPGSTGARIARNVIRDNDRMSVLTRTPTDDDSGAFGVLLQGDRSVVTHNTIVGSDAFSYDYGRDGSAVEVDGGRNDTIDHNLAVDDNAFTELSQRRSSGNSYFYNVVRSNLRRSTFLVTPGTQNRRGPVAATRAFNNTVYLTGSESEGFVCYDGCTDSVLELRNNIIAAGRKAGYAAGPVDEDFDLIVHGATQFALGPHALVAPAGFVSPTVGNFRLRRGSPAIDHGVSLGRRIDFAGDRVPVDGDGDGVARPDIGAFEYGR
jgi:hypothetical protein